VVSDDNNKRDVKMTVKIITGSYVSSLRHQMAFISSQCHNF
jgi:hypothetical protein